MNPNIILVVKVVGFVISPLIIFEYLLDQFEIGSLRSLTKKTILLTVNLVKGCAQIAWSAFRSVIKLSYLCTALSIQVAQYLFSEFVQKAEAKMEGTSHNIQKVAILFKLNLLDRLSRVKAKKLADADMRAQNIKLQMENNELKTYLSSIHGMFQDAVQKADQLEKRNAQLFTYSTNLSVALRKAIHKSYNLDENISSKLFSAENLSFAEVDTEATKTEAKNNVNKLVQEEIRKLEL